MGGRGISAAALEEIADIIAEALDDHDELECVDDPLEDARSGGWFLDVRTKSGSMVTVLVREEGA